MDSTLLSVWGVLRAKELIAVHGTILHSSTECAHRCPWRQLGTSWDRFGVSARHPQEGLSTKTALGYFRPRVSPALLPNASAGYAWRLLSHRGKIRRLLMAQRASSDRHRLSSSARRRGGSCRQRGERGRSVWDVDQQRRVWLRSNFCGRWILFPDGESNRECGDSSGRIRRGTCGIRQQHERSCCRRSHHRTEGSRI